MGWRGHLLRWIRIANRFEGNWFVDKAKVFATGALCRNVVGALFNEDRARQIAQSCPNCMCEQVSVGRYGSPGPVSDGEIVYSVVISPIDLDKDQIAVTVVTHAEKKGMSVLRDKASDDEFRDIINLRTAAKPAERVFHGVIPIASSVIRSLRAKESRFGRETNDRLYYILDTDLNKFPHHADIFITLPEKFADAEFKAMMRSQRDQMLGVMHGQIVSPHAFRDGALNT